MTYTLKITRTHGNIVISIYENGQYVDTMVFHSSEQRDLLKYMHRLIRKIVRT